MWKVTTVLFFLLFSVVSKVHGELLCYSCQMDGAATDRSCLNHPAGVTSSPPTVKCKYKHCAIIRQEYTDPAGEIYTFYRGCSPTGTESVIEGGGFKVYTRTCKSNLCNNWDGLSASGGGSGGSGGSGSSGGSSGGGSWDPGYEGAFLVPGKSASSSLSSIFPTLLLCFVALMKFVI